jgi:hypothetical protein
MGGVSGGGEHGVGGGGGSIAAGGLAAPGNMRNDTDDNTLVLDLIPADVGDLHGRGGHSAGFQSGDAFYDVFATQMPIEAQYGGGSYPVQHGNLPTLGGDGGYY